MSEREREREHIERESLVILIACNGFSLLLNHGHRHTTEPRKSPYSLVRAIAFLCSLLFFVDRSCYWQLLQSTLVIFIVLYLWNGILYLSQTKQKSEPPPNLRAS